MFLTRFRERKNKPQTFSNLDTMVGEMLRREHTVLKIDLRAHSTDEEQSWWFFHLDFTSVSLSGKTLRFSELIARDWDGGMEDPTGIALTKASSVLTLIQMYRNLCQKLPDVLIECYYNGEYLSDTVISDMETTFTFLGVNPFTPSLGITS